MHPLAPGAVIGIIGGGQLGRMWALAAANLGYKTHIFTPEKDSPASQVAAHTTVATYDDEHALAVFASRVQVVTFEFENIPHASLMVLQGHVPVFPSPKLLEISQNRIREKTFVRSLGIATAPFNPIHRAEEIPLALRMVGSPAILKTTELGYDGKGQVKLDLTSDPEDAWKKLGTHEAVLEGFVDFLMEISVIVARGHKGDIACFPPVQNIHKNHILDITVAPAAIDPALAKEAENIAVRIAEAAGLIGLLAVEMFVTNDNTLLVNELAPRPHNSGHWTMDGCMTSQFEQGVRAVCGLPLGPTQILYPTEMKNLVGDEVNGWTDILREPNAKLHLYGKREAREGRKMGHVNRLNIRSDKR